MVVGRERGITQTNNKRIRRKLDESDEKMSNPQFSQDCLSQWRSQKKSRTLTVCMYFLELSFGQSQEFSHSILSFHQNSEACTKQDQAFGQIKSALCAVKEGPSGQYLAFGLIFVLMGLRDLLYLTPIPKQGSGPQRPTAIYDILPKLPYIHIQNSVLHTFVISLIKFSQIN